MDDITYYKASISDIATLVDYRIEFLVDFWGAQSDESTNELKQQLTAYFNHAYNENTYVCYLAKSGNDVVGIGGMIIRSQPGNFRNPSGKVGYLLNMYTVPYYRRNGICRVILEKLVAEAKEKSINLLELHATADGELVYKQNGFKFHPEPTYRRYLSSELSSI